jgi:hypothetical protein
MSRGLKESLHMSNVKKERKNEIVPKKAESLELKKKKLFF